MSLVSVPNLAPRAQAVPRLSAVVPAYNEAECLPALLQRLCAQLQALSTQWEVIVVDDGSTDRTAAAVHPFVQGGGVVYLRLSRNFGKEVALSAGLDAAHGDAVLLLDADGQHPPELLPQLLERWRAGADMVYAVRRDRAAETLDKRLAARAFNALMRRMSEIDVPADAGDFRLLDRAVVDALCALPERNRYMKGLYAWVGYRGEAIEYEPAPRLHGRSKFSIPRLLRLSADGITSFTTFPLRLWSGVGMLLALASLAYAVWLLLEHVIEGTSVPGWRTLAVGLMFFSGVQLLSVGVLGEYVGRIYAEVKQRPLYLVAQRRGQGLATSAPPRTDAAAAAAR